MDDNDLILGAIKEIKNFEHRPKKVQTEYEDFDPAEAGTKDALYKIVRRERSRTSHLRKRLSDWNSRDMLNYFKSLLRDYGINVKGGTVVGSEYISKLHDKLVNKVGETNNSDIRDYLDWWAASYAPFQPHLIHVAVLLEDRYLGRFLVHRGSMVLDESSESRSSVDPDQIWRAGGLDLLLVTRGLVIAYQTLEKNGEKEPMSRILQSSKKLSNKMAQQCLESTLKNAPYSRGIDIHSLVDPIVHAHGLEQYADQWDNCFKGGK